MSWLSSMCTIPWFPLGSKALQFSLHDAPNRCTRSRRACAIYTEPEQTGNGDRRQSALESGSGLPSTANLTTYGKISASSFRSRLLESRLCHKTRNLVVHGGCPWGITSCQGIPNWMYSSRGTLGDSNPLLRLRKGGSCKS